MTDEEIIAQFRDSINGDEIWPWILLILIFGFSGESSFTDEPSGKLDQDACVTDNKSK